MFAVEVATNFDGPEVMVSAGLLESVLEAVSRVFAVI